MVVSLAIVIILTALLCFTLPMGNASAEVAFDPYSIEDKCKELSETDLLEGAAPIGDDNHIPTVEDYINNIQSGGFAEIDNVGNRLHSDWLYRIIPIELLTNECTYFHHGRAYSYYIYTFGYTVDIPCASEVFFICHVPVYNEKTGEVSLKLKVFQTGYITGQTEVGGEIQTQYNAFGTSDYYLKDVQFFVGMQNEYELNYGDSGYDKQTDDGVVLLQTRVNYKRILTQTENGDFMPLIENVFDLVLGNIPGAEGIYTVYKGIKEAQSWIGAFADCFSRREKVITEANNEIEILQYDTRESQKNDTEHPYYIRFATPASRAKHIYINDYAEIKSVLSDGKPATRAYVGAVFNIFVKSTTGEELMLLSDGTTKSYAVPENFSNEEYVKKYPPIVVQDDRVMFDNEKKAAQEGENDGYLLCKDSEQIFEFVPNRSGKYRASTKQGQCVFGDISNDTEEYEFKELKEGGTYYIHVKPKSDNGLGAYKLNIEYVTTDISVGQAVAKTVGANSSEYMAFTPTTTEVYTFTTGGSDLGVRIEDVGGEIISAEVGDVTVRLQKNQKYYVRLVNDSDESIATTVKVKPVQSVAVDGNEIVDNKNTVLKLDITHRGKYKVSISSPYAYTRLVLRDWEYDEISVVTGSSAIEERFIEGVYYLEVVHGMTANYAVRVEFVPFDIVGKSTYVSISEESVVCRFVPSADGYYNLTLDGTKLPLYDHDGNEVADTLLTAGSSYYMVVEQSGTVTVSFDTDGQLALAESYTVKAGNNMLEFTAPASGDYILDGNGTLIVLDENHEYVGSGKAINLSADKKYYFAYTASAAEDIILHFTADILVNHGSKAAHSGYHELNVTEFADYSITVMTWSGATAIIDVYDEHMHIIDHSDGGRFEKGLSEGTYFIKITSSATDTIIISVINSKQIGENLQLIEGDQADVDTPADGSVIFELDRSDKTKSAIRLSTNILIRDLPYIKIDIYSFASGEKRNVELLSNKEGEWICILEAHVYYIEFISTRAKALRFTVEGFNLLGEITVFEDGVEVPECLSRGVLTVGKTYNISVALTESGLSSTKVSMKAPSGVVLNAANSTVTLPADINLAGQSITLTFKVVDTNETKTATFQIVKPYVPSPSFYNDSYNISIMDYLYRPLNVNERTIKLSYVDGNTVTLLANNANSYDVYKLPVLGNIKIRAEITYSYPKYTETIESLYTASSNVIKRDLKTTEANSAITIFVPSNAKSLTVRGASGTVYTNFNISIAERTADLTVNLMGLIVSNSNPSAACLTASGAGTVYLNVYGVVKLGSTANGAHALSANTIVIEGKESGSAIHLNGGKCYTNGRTRMYGGSGIRSSGSVTFKNISATVMGGNGAIVAGTVNALSVGGGDGIYAKNLTVGNTKLTVIGGNGGSGASGADGKAGDNAVTGTNGGDGEAGFGGADGGYGVYINGGTYHADSASTVSITGGDGGNGGTGGRGGKGGNSSGSGKVGGRGGKGGQGGWYGKAGKACNISISANTLKDGVTGYGGQGGHGGNGGSGGSKANGGSGGNGGDSCFFGAHALGGSGGAGGSGGKTGSSGASGAYYPYNFYTGYSGAGYTFVTYNPGTITVKVSLTTGQMYLAVRNPWGGSEGSTSGSGTISVSFYASPGTKYRIELDPSSYVQYSISVT